MPASLTLLLAMQGRLSSVEKANICGVRGMNGACVSAMDRNRRGSLVGVKLCLKSYGYGQSCSICKTSATRLSAPSGPASARRDGPRLSRACNSEGRVLPCLVTTART